MQRDFCLGSEWLYYKIYTGVKIADYILLEKLEPIISDLKSKKIIQKWFFIRYKDIDEHIRIRFLINNTNNLGTVIQAFYPIFSKLIEQHLVWKIQTDTYQREIERYGSKTMIASEFLFWKDSEMILQYLLIKNSFFDNELPLFFSFYTIDSFLNSFKMSNLEKLSLMNELQKGFKKEFEIDKTQKQKMDRKHRELYPKIEQFLLGSIENDFLEIFTIVDKKQNLIKNTVLEIKNKIDIPINDFLASHIHMMINRQYTSQQRIYELIIYDHLFRFYKTQNYRS